MPVVAGDVRRGPDPIDRYLLDTAAAVPLLDAPNTDRESRVRRLLYPEARKPTVQHEKNAD